MNPRLSMITSLLLLTLAMPVTPGSLKLQGSVPAGLYRQAPHHREWQRSSSNSSRPRPVFNHHAQGHLRPGGCRSGGGGGAAAAQLT